MSTQKRSPWLKAVIISASLVVLPPIVGLVSTVTGMIKAFQSISEGGKSSPEALAGNISTALYSTGVGLVISLIAGIALVVSVIGLIGERRKARDAASQTT